MQVISIDTLKTITHIQQGDQEVYIGQVRPFHSNESLMKYINHSSQARFTHVSLAQGEEHKPHMHDTNSMLIVTEGKGALIGDLSKEVKKGDIVCIPKGAVHGFQCHYPEGLEGISIQFEGEGLFDSEEKNIRFDYSKRLLQHNMDLCKAFELSPFFQLMEEGIFNDADKKSIFYQNLKIWSEKFQDILFARQCSTIDPKFKTLFTEHILEEIGHDKLLKGKTKWDPIIDSCGDWFMVKMLQSDNIEKLVITHMVLELCGDVFHTKALKFADQSDADDYLSLHAHLDEGHAHMGSELLGHINEKQFDGLCDLSERAWKILEILLNRVAELTVAEINKKF